MLLQGYRRIYKNEKTGEETGDKVSALHWIRNGENVWVYGDNGQRKIIIATWVARYMNMGL